MANRPWIKFYPADWQADQALGMCSLAARGLWLEMLAIMHRADPYGHLLVNGKVPTDTQLAALARCPLDQIPSLLDELESAGVFSKGRNRVIYSRRLTRDEKHRKDGATAQILSGYVPGSRRWQAAEKQAQKQPPPGVVAGVVTTPPSDSYARDQMLEKKKTSPNGEAKEKTLDPEFLEFWRAYPRREDRGHAAKAYVTARKKVDGPTLLAAAERYAKTRIGQNAKFTAMPTSWLNGERWLDEVSLFEAGEGNGGWLPPPSAAGG